MGGTFDGVRELFGYNRESYFFDQELRMKREYQEQDMRVRQFVLYREDVHDLTELTTGKMDSYLLLALVELGCCLDMLVHGVIHVDMVEKNDRVQPTWLLYLYVISLAESFVYLFLSAWFAIHASVAAHSFAVRLLTQYVRLPVPNKSQLNAARSYAAEFEGAGARGMLRVPILQERLADLRGGSQSRGAEAVSTGGENIAMALASMSESNPAAARQHVRLYRDLQANWQAHDAYARACLALGTYTIIHTLAYYLIGLFVDEMRSHVPAFACCVILPLLAWLVIRLDLYFATYRMVLAFLALMSGPLLAYFVTMLTFLPQNHFQRVQGLDFICVPICFFLHIGLIASVVFVARADSTTGVALPTRFRAVLYLDVFGLLRDPIADLSPSPSRSPSRDDFTQAVQSSPERQLPARVREALVRETQVLLTLLQLELDAWEGPGNAANLRGMRELAQGVGNLREHLLMLKDAFSRVCAGQQDGGTDGTGSQPGSVPEMLANLWLRLSWNGSVEFFIKPDTGESRTRAPQDSFVSDVEGMRCRLAKVEEKVMLLLHDTDMRDSRSETYVLEGAGQPSSSSSPPVCTQVFPASEPSPTASLAADLRPQGVNRGSLLVPPNHPRTASMSSVVSGRWNSTASLDPFQRQASTELPLMNGESSSMSQAGGNLVVTFAVEDGGSGAQETRFGGQEAAQLESIPTVSYRGAETFHPRQDSRRESRTPTGQVPWNTFFWASITIGSVWMLGIGAFLIDPALYIGRTPQPVCAAETNAATTFALQGPQPLFTNGQKLLAPQQWQPRPLPLHAVDAACHESYGPRVLIAERYAVHEIQLSTNGTQLPPRRLQDVDLCLAKAPTFHSAGLAGLGLECTESGSCNVLLLAAAGDRVLVCPLSSGAETQNLPQRQQQQISAVLLGESGSSADVNRWRGLAAAAPPIGTGSKAPQLQHHWWVIRDADISTPLPQLQPPTELHVWKSFEGSLVAQQALQKQHARQQPRARSPNSRAAVISIRGAAATDTQHSPSLATASARGLFRSVHSYNESRVLALDVIGGAVHLWATSDADRQASAVDYGMEVMGTWQLPPAQRWSSICVLSNHLYAVASGMPLASGPELWRFPLPLDMVS